MKKMAYGTLLTVLAYLAIRLLLVQVRRVENPQWGILVIPVVVFTLAMLEIAWSRWRFEQLESVITSLIAGRRRAPVIRWYHMCIGRMYDYKRCLATGLAFLPLVAYLVIEHVRWSYWIPDPMVGWFDRVWIILAMGAAASSQWPFANISLFISRLPRKRLAINFYAHREASIMVLGSFMMKIDLGGVFLTFLAGIGLYLAPIEVSRLVYVILLCVFVWAIIWFFLTQYNVHRCMVLEKREKLDPIATRLMEALETSLREPTEQNVKAYNAIREVYDKVELLPEWPFNLKNVLALISGVLLPIGLSIINLLGGGR